VRPSLTRRPVRPPVRRSLLPRPSSPQDATDGDLCEQFSALPVKVQQSIAAELDRTPSEVVKKLEDFRNCIL
jgi:hypothetical protein